MNSHINGNIYQFLGIEECDLLLMIGTNPKYEAPVINSRINNRSFVFRICSYH